jgi:hypothetical protein
MMKGKPGAQLSARDINRILRGASPEIRKMLKAAHDQGYVVQSTNSQHYKVVTPSSCTEKKTVFSPSTPSDTRGLHIVRRKLRHIGVQFP